MSDQRRSGDSSPIPVGTLTSGGRRPRAGDSPAKEVAPDPAVVQTVWVRALMESLRRAGVTRAVVSPGSRSTPFTLAAEHVGMITRTIIDERSAGFFALGCARASGEPVLLICTSGSAGAHYYPAIIEAAYAHLPIVVLTADRPPELWDCAAPQTIDQTKLFGTNVRSFVELGLPDSSYRSLRALGRRAAQAVHAARWPIPGPVHINACARKPLEPRAAKAPADIAIVERSEHILRGFQPRAVSGKHVAPDDLITSLARACIAANRGVIIAGPLGPGPRTDALAYVQSVRAVARATGYPVLVEAASQLRFAPIDEDAFEQAASHGEGDDEHGNGEHDSRERPDAGRSQRQVTYIDGFDLLVADHHWANATKPELVLQIGAPPISGAWARYMQENLDCVHCVIAPHRWNDPDASVDLSVFADPTHTLTRLAACIEQSRLSDEPLTTSDEQVQAGWARRWTTANLSAWRAVDQTLAVYRDQDSGLEHDPGMREGQAMQAAVGATPDGAWLLLGNSLPIRTVDTYVPQGNVSAWVLSQRGANGIDGFLSDAAGTAWWHGADYASHVKPATVAIIGDVSFLHDIGGLSAAAGARAPICIVVIDNDGGRIFEHLPIARATHGVDQALYATHFLTRPGYNIHAAAAVFDSAFVSVSTPEALSDAVAEACTRPTLTVVHALVDPESAFDDRRQIERRLTALLTAQSSVEDPS